MGFAKHNNWPLGFSCSRWKGSALKNLTGEARDAMSRAPGCNANCAFALSWRSGFGVKQPIPVGDCLDLRRPLRLGHKQAFSGWNDDVSRRMEKTWGENRRNPKSPLL
jgi:hypothetical protein